MKEKFALLERDIIFSNGDFTSRLTLLGDGSLRAGECWLTSARFSPNDGIFFYVRDTAVRHESWSPTLRPTLSTPDHYAVRVFPRYAETIRKEGSLETRLRIGLPERGAWELRELTLTNHGKHTRTLEITSALDITLLYDRLRDLDHQTFSNLFVGSVFDEHHRALIFHRRSFSKPETYPLFSHHIVADEHAEFLGFDTAREKFLGRGHTPDSPIGLSENPGNTQGYLLDPIASLRFRVTLEPGTSVNFFAFQAAHFLPDTPDNFLETLSRYENARHTAKQIFSDTVSPVETADFTRAELRGFFPSAKPDTRNSRLASETAIGIDPARLKLWNGYGGFDPETAQYHILFSPERGLPPQPWSNILCNKSFGTIVTENALGGTWYQNSRTNRLTPWSNDPVADAPAEILYIKNHLTGAVWSVTPAPYLDSPYAITHGRGFTTYEGRHGDIHHTLSVFTDRDQPIKYLLLTVKNDGDEPVSLSIAHFLDCPLYDIPDPLSQVLPVPDWDRQALCFPIPDPSGRGDDTECAAVFSDMPLEHYLTDKREFFGPIQSILFPKQFSKSDEAARAATSPKELSTPWNRCAVYETGAFTVAPGTNRTVTFALVAAPNRKTLLKLLDQSPVSDRANQARAALADTKQFWDNELIAPHIRTPDESTNMLFNIWIPYQILSSRMWGRTAFYQSSGAFGYRDQLQDSLALIHIDPSIARHHILHCAGQQYEDGNTRWWWFPEDNVGIPSRSSDNPLWLAYAAAEYVRMTGDRSIWKETVPYLKARQPGGPDVRADIPTDYAESLWNHCQKSIEYALVFGRHGLPLIREGDWNDGMNLIGREGRGESVWLGFFLAQILDTYTGILESDERAPAELADDQERALFFALRYKALRSDLSASLEQSGWDGEWYRRAYSDSGSPIGSHKNRDCRIDSIAQSWSVLSQIASKARGKRAMKSLWEHLYDPLSDTLRLLDPPFDRDPRTPGYIKDYPPGIRENGAQYNHATLWAADAFAHLGDARHAWQAFSLTNPARRSGTPEDVALYQTEPYAVAADIYTAAPHAGMGGWTWYTASAGLMYRTLIESILGIRRESDQLIIRPCLPPEWHEASIDLPTGTSHYRVSYHSTENHKNIVVEITLDGQPITINPDRITLPFRDDGARHEIEIRLN